MSRQPGGVGWSLEVVRGREVGRRFAIGPGTTVLGNAVGGVGIDLSGQEGDSPRRMAARQAVVEVGADGLVLRDLESPGGTFVNRRRLLPGQGQPLKSGDVIQLGGVQLRVSEPGSRPAPAPDRPRPGPATGTATTTAATASKPTKRAEARPGLGAATTPLAFAIKDGPVCRSWDDFLAVSAQRWGALREELTSGRLASYLISTGRAGLAPRADAEGSPDERLDSWLGTLPTTRPARPELDVHPRSLTFRATPGALSKQVVRVSNVGFRLLRSRARVEPADVGWLSVPGEFAREFETVEETEVPVEVSVPNSFVGRMSAAIVIEGNGGVSRVAVTLEPPSPRATEPIDEVEAIGPGPSSIDELAGRFNGWLSRRGAGERSIGGAILGLSFRLGIGIACGLSGVATLPGPAVVLAATGAVAGALAIGRRGGVQDVPAGAFAGGFGGLIAAALAVAACQAVEPMLGAWLSGNLVATVALWAVLGALAGAGSLLVVPAGKGGPS